MDPNAERGKFWGGLAGLLALGGAVGVSLFAFGVGRAGEPDEAAVELDRRYAQDVKPLLEQFCFECHGGKKVRGDVRLDRVRGVADAHDGALDLALVREMVATGQMPPEDSEQPSTLQRLAIAQWLDATLAYVPPDAPVDPGWFTIHRLNRSEYRNTLRDLLGVDPARVDLAAKLPRDDTGYGFDNIADVLSVSPLALEQYMASAEQAIEAGLGPIVSFGDVPRVLRPLEGKNGQALPRGGFFLYSNGTAGSKFVASIEGEYMIRVRAWETHAGDELSKMRVKVDERPVGEVGVSGTRGEGQEFSFKVRLAAGVHAVGAQFLNDYYVKDQGDRNLAVESISVAGPLDEATSVRSAAWTRVFGAAPQSEDETGRATEILRAFATRAYRRPVDDREVQGLVGVYQAEREAGGAFEPAVRTALAAALVSPNFLYRTVANPAAGDAQSRYVLGAYELASRLSYFLWSSMPDDELFGLAANGSILKDEVLAQQVKRMLADPKSRALVENFAGQWLQLRALDTLAIDRTTFPEYTDELRADMVQEAVLFFEDVLRNDGSVLAFIDSRDSFLNERLAKFYGIAGVSGAQFRKVALPESSARGGVLTMGAVLTLTSNPMRTSPVKRGLFVLDQMLGAPPPPPPPDIPPLEQAAGLGPDATVREKLKAHTSVASCASCHNRLDPLGFSFEHFDAIGRWRETENGRSVDATGTLPGGEKLDGTGDLKRSLLAKSDRFVEALSAKMLMYALGRGVEPLDRPAVRRIAARTRANGDRLSALVESIVLSETFRTCRGRDVAR